MNLTLWGCPRQLPGSPGGIVASPNVRPLTVVVSCAETNVGNETKMAAIHWRRRTVMAAGLGGMTFAAVRRALAAGKPPVKIGWLVALTGPNSSPGIGFDRGIHFAVEEANKTGGVSGREIQVITRDT